MTVKTEIHQIDAFSRQPFGGNPAAVTLLPEYPDDEWMQQVAAEMNLSETAFLRPRDDGFDLRWFTPEVEVELCGHATLASAHFLWERRPGRSLDRDLVLDSRVVGWQPGGAMSGSSSIFPRRARKRWSHRLS